MSENFQEKYDLVEKGIITELQITEFPFEAVPVGQLQEAPQGGLTASAAFVQMARSQLPGASEPKASPPGIPSEDEEAAMRFDAKATEEEDAAFDEAVERGMI